MELRVYAEDPTNNFLPDIGRLETYVRPQGPGVRVDDGLEEGMDIPIYYDPMIAKLVTWGQTREEAMDRMIRAVDEYRITGLRTTLPFGKFVMQHPAFRSGDFDTHFISKYFTPEMLNPKPDALVADVAAVLAAKLYAGSAGAAASASNGAQPTMVEVANGGMSGWRRNRG